MWIAAHNQHETTFIVMTIVILHNRIGRGMIAVKSLSICCSVGFISLIVLQHCICRLKGPDSYIISCILETTVFCKIVFNQSSVCIADSNTISANMFHIVSFYYHIGRWIPVNRHARIILFPLVTPLGAYQLNGRTVYPFKSTAGNTDVVIFTWHTCQLSILNVRLYIKEYTAIPL